MNRFHCLPELLLKVLRKHFPGYNKKLTVQWATISRRKSAKADWWAYYEDDGSITFNPCLDRPYVPQFFIEYLLIHEILHAIIPWRKVNGKLDCHPPEFYILEGKFSVVARAKRWEQNYGRFVSELA